MQLERIKMVDKRTPHESSWAPLLWAMKLLTRAKDEGRITISEPVFANLQSSFSEIEDCNRKLLSYGWVNFPLAYTQVRSRNVLLEIKYLLKDYLNRPI